MKIVLAIIGVFLFVAGFLMGSATNNTDQIAHAEQLAARSADLAEQSANLVEASERNLSLCVHKLQRCCNE